MALTESYIAGPVAPAVRDITLGQLLERAAASAPDRIALIAGVPDPTLRRQWTYSELYTEAQRTAVTLRFGSDLPIADIAGRMGRTAGAVKLLLNRGLAAIRSQLDAAHVGEERP